jgi:hypothetical protein
MDIFTINKTTYTNGEVVNDLDTKLWVERYREPGEFKFTCKPTEKLRSQLSRGTLISHLDTLYVMMVEDHEIQEDSDGTSIMTITGRSVDAFFENRMALPNNFGLKSFGTEVSFLYDQLSATSWAQAASLLNDQIRSPLNAAQDALPNITILSSFVTATETPKERVIDRAQLDVAFKSVLEQSDIGIRVERPNGGTTNLFFILYNGTDVSGSVRFDYSANDFASARYFWSIRTLKNGAQVVGKYQVSITRPVGLTGWDVRMLYVDASDFDTLPGTQAETDAGVRKLASRGQEELGKNKETQLLEATISTTCRPKFRKDYQIGDIVYVIGNYGISQKMRVVEFAETEDGSGISGFPTLKSL